ncbi:interleukin 1 receptor like 1 [Homo sapiens]|uniref:Isoform C of Interleukin-1 receptor-like 1 n=1 Tax=Homo sapiens TaxID=9606 RepID=Q01638-3|nr:hCG26685, isoform CRA_c [Homo sapiens]KAI2524561.1 interleukin 1 receptor like 1 [Homo sapiens]KAI4035718.1 interleukin 1 receptor like 1 [Homo sapiens]
MGFWILAILTILMYSTAAKFSKQSWGLENEALIVRCPRQGKPSYTVDWYYSQTNKSIPTQERNRVFASGQLLKFLPAAVADSGIYTCIVRSPTFNRTGYANVTIYKKQSDCNVPDYLMYSTVSGSEKNSKIYCPTIDLYNWTAPLEWFKNCQALQGSRYRAHKSFLVIDNVMTEDAGDYTCKFIHNENGANYSVTATRSFTVKVWCQSFCKLKKSLIFSNTHWIQSLMRGFVMVYYGVHKCCRVVFNLCLQYFQHHQWP